MTLVALRSRAGTCFENAVRVAGIKQISIVAWISYDQVLLKHLLKVPHIFKKVIYGHKIFISRYFVSNITPNGQAIQGRGVFDQQFDPLVFENFSKFATKSAKMTVKE